MPEVLITGAAGRVGDALRRGLGEAGVSLALTDRVSFDDVAEASVGDLADLDFALSVVRDVDAVIHAAGIPDEAPFDALVDANIRATYNVFEAARRNGVPRVIFASSAHVVGFHSREETIDASVPLRPDTVYGATKAFGEALASLYADKFGLEVVSIRIGSFREEPENHRQLSTWLSHRDAVALVLQCLKAPVAGHTIVYGVSGNRTKWWTHDGWEDLGFTPQDDADSYAHLHPAGPDEPGARWQGGIFAETDYTGGAG